MSFIRPEIQDGIKRWRAVLVPLAVIALAVYLAFSDFVLRRWLGYALLGIGGFLLWDGIRRVRFPAPGGGAGVVDVDERQITYFGPIGGAAMSIDELERIEIRSTDLGPMVADLYWDFFDSSGASMTIPGNAENVDLLFDVLGVLGGADFDAATRAAMADENAVFVIWEK